MLILLLITTLSASPVVKQTDLQKSLRGVFVKKSKDIQECYEKALKVSPDTHGSVKLEFDLLSGGKVDNAKVRSESTIKNKKLHHCLLDKLRSWQFPKTNKKQSINVIYPLVLKEN